MLRRIVASACVCFCVGLGGAAFASHYLLDDVQASFPADLLASFERFGCEDTEDALNWLLTPDQRRSFASSTGVSPIVVNENARILDLLQVGGVGPRAARLLMAAGVESSSDLARRDPESLLAEVETVNMVEGLTSVSPSLDHVRQWVDAAGRVPLQVTW